uniref:Polar amino acid ABC transporter, inner membrane subunit n=1 Tax=Cyanothece sp. (strain PCC 7425 / ATCC 29141) TaxID=395961 RepID=B8HKT2_CYAP4
METSIQSSPPRSRAWLRWLDYGFYVLVAIALGGFLYYLYSSRVLLIRYFPFLVQATVTTLGISITSMVLAMVLGGIGAWGRLSKWALVRGVAIVYVEVVRGTPTLVQLLLWGFGIGTVMSQLGFDPRALAFNLLTPLQSNSLVSPVFNFIFYGVLGLSFNYGAYLTEVFRAGIESISRGQTEAALSLGLDSVQTMGRIVLPQAIRLTIPPFTNNFITLIQDSALLSTIGVTELQQVTSSFAYPLTNPNDKLFVFILGALFYLALCYPLSRLARYLERKLAKGA